jgi:hypothetical protein
VLAARNFNARWEPGRIISVLHEGRLLGVLLDKKLPEGELWQGFMAASEADWAGAHDVLLEPGDEPFEPLFGLIQAWNTVTLAPAAWQVARVQGEISATRLAAVRAVHDEFEHGTAPAIDPEPGRIALRGVAGGSFTVLSGTPLGPQDERAQYQQLYRDAALRLGAAALRSAPAAAPAAPAQAQDASGAAEGAGGVAGRLRRWFGADAWVRPAFALLALVVVVQNAALLGGDGAAPDDEVRFRDAPAIEANSPSADLAVVWKADVSMEAATRLLRSLQAEVVAGPDARGAWFLRVPDLTAGSVTLSASPLVQSVGPP